MNRLATTVQAFIDDPDYLTPAQRKAVQSEGNFAVIACPGSGKTRTVGARLACRIANWQHRHSGVAALSFTNVAQDEIRRQLRELGVRAGAGVPHFLGTINSFVNRFVFLPFGHLVMAEKPLRRRPNLILDYNEDWVAYRFKLEDGLEKYRVIDFHFTLDGSFTWLRPRGQPGIEPPPHFVGVARQKRKLAAFGYATHSDAMFYALETLRRHPRVARSVAGRFREILIDEFQDTSELQLEILRTLLRTKRCTMGLIGDPDQSIYEFHHAEPTALAKIRAKGTWPVYELDRNFRSSQLICSAIAQFSSRSSPASAAGEDRECPFEPIVFPFEDKEVSSLAPLFLEIIKEAGIEPAKAVITTLKNSVVKRIAGDRQPKRWPPRVTKLARKLACAAFERDSGFSESAFCRIEYSLLELRSGKSDYGWQRENLGDVPYREWVHDVCEFLNQLPKADSDLNSWLSAAKPRAEAFVSRKGWQPAKELGRVFSRSRKGGSKPVAEFIQHKGTELPFAVKTIHGVKGETYDATLVVGSPVLKKGGESDVPGWFPASADSDVHVESVRRVYVAMSRPRKLLAIAVPRSAWHCCRRSMKGFRFVDFSRESPGEVLLCSQPQEGELGQAWTKR